MRIIDRLGPGLVTGAADDDPSGIATYSQAGAQFGFQMLWSVVLCLPMMIAIQSICGRIGCVTGQGLASAIKRVFPKWLLAPLIALLLIANVINIAADVAAMGEAAHLVLPQAPVHLYTVAFGVLTLGLQLFIRYERYVLVLKWLTLSLLSYVAVIFTVHIVDHHGGGYIGHHHQPLPLLLAELPGGGGHGGARGRQTLEGLPSRSAARDQTHKN